MSSIYGKNISLSLFGESHGTAVGAVLDGFPAEYQVDRKKIDEDLMRRSAASKYGSGRNEPDALYVLSGIKDDVTVGSPITFIFENKDVITEDYDDMRNILRPGHSDRSSQVRYGDKMSGGGHLSGRLTTPITAAGSLCRQYLESEFKLKFITKVIEFGGEKLKKPIDPTLEDSAEINLLYEKAKLAEDSYGAILKTIITGLPEGLGSPIFGNVESKISEILFGIPGLKGISFGLGFDIAGLKGSEANDPFYVDKKYRIRTKSNNAGGILGGITTGMPLVINLAFKPTPTIGTEQVTVDVSEMEEVRMKGSGRHDVSYALRVSPVIESAVSIAILDMFMERDGYSK